MVRLSPGLAVTTLVFVPFHTMWMATIADESMKMVKMMKVMMMMMIMMKPQEMPVTCQLLG